MTGRSGDLYATRNGRRSWAEVEHAPFRTGTVRRYLERPVVQRHGQLFGLQLLCVGACAATSPYLVTHSADGGSSWSTMPSDWPGASAATAPVADLDAVAAGSEA